MSLWYITQAGAGTANGQALSSAWPVSAQTWGGAGIKAGDTVYLSGTFTTPLTCNGSGAVGNPIFIQFMPGASFSALSSSPWPSNGAIQMQGKGYLTIDGCANGPIGGVYGNPANINGRITNTLNLPNSAGVAVNSIGVYVVGCTGINIQNLAITGLYYSISGSGFIGLNSACIYLTWTGSANNSYFGNITINNCYLSDAEFGFQYTYANSYNYVFTNNTCTNVSNGGYGGDVTNGSVLSGLYVSGNRMYGFNIWDQWGPIAVNSVPSSGAGYLVGDIVALSGLGANANVVPASAQVTATAGGGLVTAAKIIFTGNGIGYLNNTTYTTWGGNGTGLTLNVQVDDYYHHNVFYGWSVGGGVDQKNQSILNNVLYTNNVVGPGFGNFASSGLFVQGRVLGASAINNILIADQFTPDDGLIFFDFSPIPSTFYSLVAHNTFIGPGSAVAGTGTNFAIDINYGPASAFPLMVCGFLHYNNAYYNMQTAIAGYYINTSACSCPLSSDYNSYYGVGSSNAWIWSSNPTGAATSFRTLSSWQALSGGTQDLHCIYQVAPKFVGNYIPTLLDTSWRAKGFPNMLSAVSVDFSGHGRPLLPAIGAQEAYTGGVGVGGHGIMVAGP